MASSDVAAARDLVDRAIAVAVLTGAGISTDSGIPDFRGPQGVWTKNPDAEKASHISYYVSDPDLRKRGWARRATGEIWPDVEPNLGHHAVVHLERRGKLHTLITQNVDGLHRAAGTDPTKMVEVHGNTREVACLSCDYRTEMETALERVRAGEEDPLCPDCGGLLKSATVSFGQSLDPGDLMRAEVAANEADLLLAVGTSLTVFPINEIAVIAHRAGARLVIVTFEPTPYDHVADVVVNESISEVLPAIVGMDDD